jgi:hypothetical protein
MKASARLLVENGSQVHSSHIGCILCCVAFALAPLGCTSNEPSVGEDDDAGTFTAYLSDFQSFHSWPSFTFYGAAITDSPHTAGMRTEYINHLPPAGATSFPLGTIIVKELADGVTFSMVKVGGGYNPDGAIDWAWYELVNQPDGSVRFQWGPVAVAPQGDPYATSPVTCNQCHVGEASKNDDVQSWALNLARLESGAPFDGGAFDAAVGTTTQDAALDGASE